MANAYVSYEKDCKVAITKCDATFYRIDVHLTDEVRKALGLLREGDEQWRHPLEKLIELGAESVLKNKE